MVTFVDASVVILKNVNIKCKIRHKITFNIKYFCHVTSKFQKKRGGGRGIAGVSGLGGCGR